MRSTAHLPSLTGLLAGLSLLVFGAIAAAAPVRTAHVEAELVPERTAFAPGQPNTVALRLKMESGWHTYWLNPGDSGLPTTLEWQLPGGISAAPIEWPAPHALPAGPLVNYGYEGEVLLLTTLKAIPDFLSGRSVTLKGRADWLVCRETCIPEGADLALTLPVDPRGGTATPWAERIAATRAALPKPLTGWEVEAAGKGQFVELKLKPAAGAEPLRGVHFFSDKEGRIEASGAQKFSADGAEQVVVLPVAYQLNPGFTRLTGVVAAESGFGAANGNAKAVTIDVPLAGAVIAGPKPAEATAATVDFNAASAPGGDRLSLFLAALFAFAGGIILNLMPCVFPVLSIKVLGFAEHHDSARTMRGEAMAFSGGVVLTFVLLGGLLLVLRAAGQQLGWGFQLQSPVVVTGLALLFFVLALNLSGVFEFGQAVPAALRGITAKNRTLDAFASGVLAVVVASPCTAPFMGAALGFALAQPPASTMVVFVALGLGMALPYALLAWFPGWRRALPRPGAWMVRFKQFLAFPLYATVAWLAWVLGAQMDNDAVLRLLVTMIALALALWAWHASRLRNARGWTVLALAALAAAVWVVRPLAVLEAPPLDATTTAAKTSGPWLPYSPERVAALGASSTPVFVDFTAAWCVTCQVNKKLVLTDPGVLAAFTKSQVTLVRADWTRRDPAITRALTALGRNGVPVYVLYRPGKEPKLLPEVLTRQTVIDALATL